MNLESKPHPPVHHPVNYQSKYTTLNFHLGRWACHCNIIGKYHWCRWLYYVKWSQDNNTNTFHAPCDSSWKLTQDTTMCKLNIHQDNNRLNQHKHCSSRDTVNAHLFNKWQSTFSIVFFKIEMFSNLYWYHWIANMMLIQFH